MGKGIKVYKNLVGKPKGKRPLRKPRCRQDQDGSWGDWLGGGMD
jgi:hypothetical protein